MSGFCVACRSGAYHFDDEKLCAMCYTSPYYTNLRRIRMEAVKADGGGLRMDAGKSRVDLIPTDALIELGKVYAAGDLKYAPIGGPRNWERGMKWSQVIGPLMRHLFKWMLGETWDTEETVGPPQRHIAKVAWNAMALLTYELRRIGEDDRASVPPPKTT